MATSKPKMERGAHAGAQRRLRFFLNLGMQGMLLFALVAASAFARRDPDTVRLYLWTTVVPAGFGVIYFLAYQRGERQRASGQWTPEWERGEARRNYAWLGLVGLAWVAGALALITLRA